MGVRGGEMNKRKRMKRPSKFEKWINTYKLLFLTMMTVVVAIALYVYIEAFYF